MEGEGLIRSGDQGQSFDSAGACDQPGGSTAPWVFAGVCGCSHRGARTALAGAPKIRNLEKQKNGTALVFEAIENIDIVAFTILGELKEARTIAWATFKVSASSGSLGHSSSPAELAHSSTILPDPPVGLPCELVATGGANVGPRTLRGRGAEEQPRR